MASIGSQLSGTIMFLVEIFMYTWTEEQLPLSYFEGDNRVVGSELYSWISLLLSLKVEAGHSVVFSEIDVQVFCRGLLFSLAATSSGLILQIKGRNPRDLGYDLFKTIKINVTKYSKWIKLQK